MRIFHSKFQLTDKTGDLPNSNSWLGGWGKRSRSVIVSAHCLQGFNQLLCRALSESSSTPDKLDTVAWLGGWAIPKKNNSTTNTPNNTPNMTSGFLIPERHRIRRSSSKDVEEAMAGGLRKVCLHNIIFYKNF